MKDYDRPMPHGFKELQVKRRRLVPENKLPRILDRVFIPSSAIRNVIEETREERSKGVYHSRMSDTMNYIICGGIPEIPRLIAYGFAVYEVFK